MTKCDIYLISFQLYFPLGLRHMSSQHEGVVYAFVSKEKMGACIMHICWNCYKIVLLIWNISLNR